MTFRSLALPAPLPLEPTPGLGWLVLLPLTLLILLQTMVALSGAVGASGGDFADPDAYMRLARVHHLAEGGAWFDARFPRINPPEGHVQHWTRPLDLLLLAGAGLVQPWLGLDRAIWLAGMLVSPLLLAAAVLALNWAITPLVGREARLLACFLFLLQPLILAYSSLGRADHHSLLLLLFVLQLGLIIRCLGPDGTSRHGLLAGMAAALAIWVSTEALVAIGTSLVSLGLAWLVGERSAAARLREFGSAAAVTLGLALLIERGGHDPLAVENDRISLVHILLFTLIWAVWHTERWLRCTLRAWPAGRLGFVLTGGLLIAITMLVVFPDLRTGPLGEVDPLYHDLRLVWIMEIQPLVPAEWVAAGRFGQIAGRVLAAIGLVVALPAMLIWLQRRGWTTARPWLPVGTALLVFLPLTMHQTRWGLYAEALLVIPYALILTLLLDALGRRLSGAALRASHLLTATLAFLWPFMAVIAFPPPAVATTEEACPMSDLAPALDARSDRPLTVMTLTDFGSELLYRTRHSVLSIPNHRPQPGFRATVLALGGADEAQSRALMARHGVSWVLLCGGGAEEAFFHRAAANPESGLYARLRTGDQPDWLRPVPLPELGASTVRLFAFEPAFARAR